jgi:hypothetical protein
MVTKVKGGVLDESALSGKNMTGDIAFDTTTLKIDSSNNRIGIGTASPSTLLHLGGTAPGDSIIRQDSTSSGTNWEIGERAAGKWQIFEDDGDSIVTTFMSSGNVGIGTTSPNAKLDILGTTSDQLRLRTAESEEYKIGRNSSTGFLDFYGTQSSYTGYTFGGVNGTRMTIDGSGLVGIGRTPSSSTGSMLQVEGNDGIAMRRPSQTNNFTLRPNASTDGMRFTQEGAGDRMVIDASGNLLMGTTYAEQDTGAGVKIKYDNSNGRVFTISSNSSGECFSAYQIGSGYKFYVTNNGKIHTAVGPAVYSPSDKRLKENIKDLDKGLTDILKLKPRRFDWKEGKGSGEKNVSGFIAQECEEAGFEEFVGEFKDNTLTDAKSFSHGGLVPALVKAIQEQQTIIEELKANSHPCKELHEFDAYADLIKRIEELENK